MLLCSPYFVSHLLKLESDEIQFTPNDGFKWKTVANGNSTMVGSPEADLLGNESETNQSVLSTVCLLITGRTYL